MKLFSIGVLLLAAFQITLGAAADSTVSAPACGVSIFFLTYTSLASAVT